MHRPNQRDVELAFSKMRRITGADATIEYTSQPVGPAIIELAGDCLEGRFFGAATALIAIESYTRGYGHGKDDGLQDRAAAELFGSGLEAEE
jgi:hypothetical protein